MGGYDGRSPELPVVLPLLRLVHIGGVAVGVPRYLLRQNIHRILVVLRAMAWFVLFILFGFAMITYHTQLVLSNLTTNEHMNMGRYEHFRDSNGMVRNPWDCGVLG